jgi:hypothetical protein
VSSTPPNDEHKFHLLPGEHIQLINDPWHDVPLQPKFWDVKIPPLVAAEQVKQEIFSALDNAIQQEAADKMAHVIDTEIPQEIIDAAMKQSLLENAAEILRPVDIKIRQDETDFNLAQAGMEVFDMNLVKNAIDSNRTTPPGRYFSDNRNIYIDHGRDGSFSVTIPVKESTHMLDRNPDYPLSKAYAEETQAKDAQAALDKKFSFGVFTPTNKFGVITKGLASEKVINLKETTFEDALGHAILARIDRNNQCVSFAVTLPDTTTKEFKLIAPRLKLYFRDLHGITLDFNGSPKRALETIYTLMTSAGFDLISTKHRYKRSDSADSLDWLKPIDSDIKYSFESKSDSGRVSLGVFCAVLNTVLELCGIKLSAATVRDFVANRACNTYVENNGARLICDANQKHNAYVKESQKERKERIELNSKIHELEKELEILKNRSRILNSSDKPLTLAKRTRKVTRLPKNSQKAT